MLHYLGVNEVAEALGVSRQTVYQLFKRQDFPSIRLGHRLLVAEDKLDTWLSQGGTNGEPLNPTR